MGGFWAWTFTSPRLLSRTDRQLGHHRLLLSPSYLWLISLFFIDSVSNAINEEHSLMSGKDRELLSWGYISFLLPETLLYNKHSLRHVCHFLFLDRSRFFLIVSFICTMRCYAQWLFLFSSDTNKLVLFFFMKFVCSYL